MTAWCAPLNTWQTKTIKSTSGAFYSCAAFHRSPWDAFSNLSTALTLFERKKHFSFFSLYCHQQFYSRMSSCVNLKSNHHFIFLIFSAASAPFSCGLKMGDRDRALSDTCWQFLYKICFIFSNRLKMIHYQAYIGRMKYPMFIHHRRWWMAALMVSCVNQSGWLIRSADSETQGDGYSNP